VGADAITDCFNPSLAYKPEAKARIISSMRKVCTSVEVRRPPVSSGPYTPPYGKPIDPPGHDVQERYHNRLDNLDDRDRKDSGNRHDTRARSDTGGATHFHTKFRRIEVSFLARRVNA
jgi:hypothetical protein